MKDNKTSSPVQALLSKTQRPRLCRKWTLSESVPSIEDGTSGCEGEESPSALGEIKSAGSPSPSDVELLSSIDAAPSEIVADPQCVPHLRLVLYSVAIGSHDMMNGGEPFNSKVFIRHS